MVLVYVRVNVYMYMGIMRVHKSTKQTKVCCVIILIKCMHMGHSSQRQYTVCKGEDVRKHLPQVSN